MFISVEQIKAARALLSWNQEELAAHAGLNTDQIRSFESGRSKSLEVLTAVHQAFTAHGLDFVNGGVVPRQVSSYVLDSYMDVLEDICRSMLNGGEVLKHCVDHSRSTPEVIKKVKEMREAGIRERLTISAGDDYITGNPEDYRQIPAAYFAASEVIVIYLNKVVFFVDGKALVIVNQNLARVFKDQFEYWWKEGKKIHGKKK